MPVPAGSTRSRFIDRVALLDTLRDSRYRTLWTAGVCVNTARWMDFLVLGWLVLEITDSPFMVAAAAFCRGAPMMAIGPFAGILADRLDRGKLMVIVQSVNVAACLGLATMFATGSVSLLPLLALHLTMGTAWAVDFPSRRTTMYTLVGPRRLANAFSIESLSQQMTKMVGPVLAGVLIGGLGPLYCYLVMATLFAVALLLVVSLDKRISLPRIGSTDSVFASLAAGLREAQAQPTIRGVLIITTIANAMVFPYQQFLPVFARDLLGVGPELLGVLVAADGLGALSVAILVASRRGQSGHSATFAGGAMIAAVLVVALSLSPWYALSLAIQFVLGIGECMFGAMQSTLVLLNAPERSRGRVMGILSFCIGTQPIGALIGGMFATVVGAPLFCAIMSACAAVVMAPTALRMTRPEPLHAITAGTQA